MAEHTDGLPVVPHLASEFYAWLWWSSEKNEAAFDLDGEGKAFVWVDERLAFRAPSESKVSAVMTGENPSTALETRAALAGGKVLQELRIGLRRDDREFFVTLKGAAMDFQRVVLPDILTEGGEEVVYDRMFHYQELTFVISRLWKQFAKLRASKDWGKTVLPALQQWTAGEE